MRNIIGWQCFSTDRGQIAKHRKPGLRMAGLKDSVEETQRVSMLYCIGVSLSYAAVSVAITFVNKIVLSVYQFQFEQTLILAQLLVGSLAIYFLSLLGICRIPTFDYQIAFKALPLSIWFFLYVVTGLGSLRSLTVPTWSALRRLTALCILFLDAFVDARSKPLVLMLQYFVPWLFDSACIPIVDSPANRAFPSCYLTIEY